MLWSKLFIPTLREAPAGISTAGGRVLTRAGYIRGDTHLFLGKRSLDRIARVIREELAALDAQEFSSRKTPLGLAAREPRSYKQLPQVWYQVHEGLEAWSFGLERIEFLEIARAILRTLESAVSEPKPPAAPDPEGDFAPEPFPTPNRKTIAELAEFTGLPDSSHIKSVVFANGETLYLALLRGDHQLSQDKFEGAVGIDGLIPAGLGQIRAAFGASAGSLGPVGAKGVRVLTDEALRGRCNMIAGANRDDCHLRHVTPGKDFAAEFFDLRQAAEGETHQGEPLRLEKAVVIASSYPVPSTDLQVTDETEKEIPIYAGSFRMFLDRILWAAAEQHHDQDGLVLPAEIAPFDLVVTPVDFSVPSQRAAAENIAEAAGALGLDVLIDDRDERPGVKFKDADLIGVSVRVTIGKKLEQGMVEVVDRRSKHKTDVAVAVAVEFIGTRR